MARYSSSLAKTPLISEVFI